MKQKMKQAGQTVLGVLGGMVGIFLLAASIDAGSYRPAVGQTATATIVAVASPAATLSYPIFTAPVAAKVTLVTVTPQAAATGNSTNTRHLNVVNKGATGAGTTEIGALDLDTGVNLVAFDESNAAFNATYLTPGVNLAEGDVLALELEKIGTSIDLPQLSIRVEWVPR